MKKILITLNALLLTVGINAQTFEWAKSFGSNELDGSRSISVDASGNVYTTGFYRGTVDFDPGSGTINLTSAGNADVFVQKLDASGNFLWVKSFGSNVYFDLGNSIMVDNQGNVYTTGKFEGTVDFDPGTGIDNHTTAGQTDVFIQKLDASGNFIWAKTFGGSSDDEGMSIAIDALGNLYTIGTYKGTADFDPGTNVANHTSTGQEDVFIQKLDSSGNFLWAKSFGGIFEDEGISVTVDASGNIYSIGNFEWTVDFDPGAGVAEHTSAGDEDVFIQKLDSSGDFLWAKSFGSNDEEYGSSVTVDASGNVYIAGRFEDTVDFDPGTGVANHTSLGSSDAFIQKLDASGDFLWVKTFGGSSFDYVASIIVDSSGNIYTNGNFFETIDLDPGAGVADHTSAGQDDVFIQKLDASGNFLWAESFGGSFSDGMFSMKLDAIGNLYTTGWFQNTVDFDPGAGVDNHTAAGSWDIFVQKMSQCSPTTGTDVQTACDAYTWIDGNTYTSSNNTATFTLTNTAGCDSVVTLNLTINSVSDITTSLSELTITATNSNATYQWLDCDNNYAVIDGETNQTFTATINGNYAVELTENGCVDTSSCVSITTVGIIENDFGNSLLIYPNPTSGDFSIDLGTLYKIAQTIITDISGKVIQSQNITQAQIINLSIDDPAGIYFVSIQAGSKKAVIRLVKE